MQVKGRSPGKDLSDAECSNYNPLIGVLRGSIQVGHVAPLNWGGEGGW